MGVRQRTMDSRREQRLQEATRELNEEEQAEADRQRAKEDEMIAQVEKDFFEYTKKLEEGIPVGASVLDSIIDDEALDRLLEFFEKGGTVDLQASDDRPQLELEEGEAASVPHADPETIKKVPPCAVGVARSSIESRQAEEVVKMLTQQIQTLETNTAAAIEQQEEEETVVVDPLSACVLPVRPARHSQLLITTRSQAPEFEMSESEDSVTLRISLPAVRKVPMRTPLMSQQHAADSRMLQVGQIDAEVVERSRLELRVPELYSLDYTFSKPVDDDQMSCRFEKTTKTLVIKMPLLVS